MTDTEDLPAQAARDAGFMREAVALAESVRGRTSPNPPVGAVLVDDAGEIVGRGATAPVGGPHAEVSALRDAGGRARGASAYVTLEPCAHHGRTPPCVDALLAAEIAAVHFAVADPNPVAAAGGAALAAAGVVVRQGLLLDEVARGPLRAWLHRQRTGRPMITWKYASTLDGRVAAADGTSRWISCAASRAEVHELRAKVDAIMVGTRTVLADDPRLTARRQDGSLAERQPLRVVVGKTDPPVNAKVLDDAAETLRLRTNDPANVLAALADRGALEVLLEGGPTLAGAFLAAGLIDRVLAYLAPSMLGAGPQALADAGVSTITRRHQFVVEDVTMSGTDVRITAVPTAAAVDAEG